MSSPIPDISGIEGESLAQALETGPGAGPTTADAVRLTALATQAIAANVSLVGAQTQLLASGESAPHPGLVAKLTRAIAWMEAVAGHAQVLAAGYETAGALHTTTLGQVGPSAEWRMLKTALAEAQVENAMNGGLSQSKVDALDEILVNKDQVKGNSMNIYQNGGETLSALPANLPDPGLDPNGDSDDAEQGDKDRKKSPEVDDAASGMQDMLNPIMGAMGPLMQSLGKANPLQTLGQLAQQLGQQASKLGSEAAKKAVSPPLKPAALASTEAVLRVRAIPFLTWSGGAEHDIPAASREVVRDLFDVDDRRAALRDIHVGDVDETAVPLRHGRRCRARAPVHARPSAPTRW